MSLLFDISAAEDGGKKRPPKRAKAQAAEEPVFRHEPKAYKSAQPRILRKINDTFDCADAACGTQCHDVIAEEPGYWYLTCVFCGTSQWVEAIPEKAAPEKPPADGVFRFDGGRFPGMTLDEVCALDDGLAYIRWVAGSPKQPTAVRKACQAHLDRADGHP